MPKQFIPVTSAIELDCVSISEMYGVKGQNTRRFALILMPVSGVIYEPRSVTSDVWATYINIIHHSPRIFCSIISCTKHLIIPHQIPPFDKQCGFVENAIRFYPSPKIWIWEILYYCQKVSQIVFRRQAEYTVRNVETKPALFRASDSLKRDFSYGCIHKFTINNLYL